MLKVTKILCLSFALCISCFSLNASDRKEKLFVVGFAQDTMANDWRAAQVKDIATAFKKYANVKFIYTDGKGRSAKQISDLEDLALKKVDLIMTSPGDGLVMTPVIDKIYKSGIPIVLITRRIKSNSYTSFVSPNDADIAKKAADFIAKKLNGKGNILVLRGLPTATTAIARTEGFVQEINKYSDLHITAIKNGNYLRIDAIRAVAEAIEKNIQFDAIYAQSDSMASGARLALKKAGVDPSGIVIVGIDYISEAQEAIKQGLQTVSFMYPTCAEESVEVVMDILNGKSVPRYVQVDSKVITKNNVFKISPIF